MIPGWLRRAVGQVWVLAVATCLWGGVCRAASEVEARLLQVEGRDAGFLQLTPGESGLDFTNHLSDARAAENQIRLNGSGVALGDVDGDGWCDIYLCGLDNPNALYRNLGGWTFTNVTLAAGVACDGQDSTGAVLADIDGDTDVDLVVNGVGVGTRLFLNDGRGRFTEVQDSGLSRQYGATSCALGDVDGDGDLDLYVANYRTETIRSTGFAVLNVGGRRMFRPEDRDRLEYTAEGRVLEHGEPHFLYRNEGGGRFTPLSWTDGTFRDEDGKALSERPRDWGLSVMFRDLNGDHHPDLYVCNDFHSTDKIWLNDGRGGFRLLPRLAMRHTPTFSMCVDFADVNRDGWEDIYVSDMLSRYHPRRMMQYAGMDPQMPTSGVIDDRPQYDHTALQMNRGDGTYADRVFAAGLQFCDWTWSAVFLDVDLDGYEDLLCVCGHQFDTQDLDAQARIWAMGPWPREKIPQKLLQFPRMRQPKLAFRNQGDATFAERGAVWGFNEAGVAQGMATGDLDRDGDLDVVVNNMNMAASLFRNEGRTPRVSVRLRGDGPNTGGVGARIRLVGGAVPLQMQERISGGRYLSDDEGVRVFATGRVREGMRLEVDWRDGRRTVVTDVVANHEYLVSQAGSVRPSPEPAPPAAPLFEDRSELLKHAHREAGFDDFVAQPLLPWRRSSLGPGITWMDLNGDGPEELFIGGGRGGALGVFRWTGEGEFQQLRGSVVSEPLSADQTGSVGWVSPTGKRWLLMGQAAWEGGGEGGVVGYDLTVGAKVQMTPAEGWDVGPLAVADLDGDGDLDLLVGGGAKPGRYPEAGRTVCYRWDRGGFAEDPVSTEVLSGAGLVQGAVISDLDGDGDGDVVLACSWGPVRIYRNERGVLQEVTDELGLGAWTGWWNGVATGDFDGDGRMDLVAGNWGGNTKYQASAAHPRRLYFGDLDGNGTQDVVETYVDTLMNQEVPERDLKAMSAALPWVLERYPTHGAYGQASIQEILGDALKSAQSLSVNTLNSMVFLNRGDHFEGRPLPAEAQLAPAWAVVVADYDGDGHEDCFLSQNFFGYQLQTTRADAGRGLLLRGDGQGGFLALSGEASGLLIYGDQRGAAAGDYDHDGRVDLVVSQNAAGTVLCHNVGGLPGFLVRLQGPDGNPLGVGAQVRLRFGSRLGPAREIQAGSGYWSQSTSQPLLGRPTPPSGVWVRWPGGSVTESALPQSADGVRIDVSGKAVVFRRGGGGVAPSSGS